MLLKNTAVSIEFLKIRLQGKFNDLPTVGVVLGSGFGDFIKNIENPMSIDYKNIPHFVSSTAPGHSGKLIFGTLRGVNIVLMQGRSHYYEGYTSEEITYPIRVLSALGLKKIVLTNASGGINKDYKPGDLMIIRDHINFMGTNPLIGKNHDNFGPRFPDMTNAYNPKYRALLKAIAQKLNLNVHEGVYVGTTGPSYETPSEVKMFQLLGADAVGMSTVPEVIVAKHCGMEIAAISCITNMAAGILDQPITEEEVIETASKVIPMFSRLIQEFVIRI